MKRKDQVIELSKQGKSTNQIARELGVSTSYVQPIVKVYKLEQRIKELEVQLQK